MSKTNYDGDLTALQLVAQLRKRTTVTDAQLELLYSLVEQENTPEKRLAWDIKRAKQAVTRTKREATYARNKATEAHDDYENAQKELQDLLNKNPA